jgi:hypothetical protein
MSASVPPRSRPSARPPRGNAAVVLIAAVLVLAASAALTLDSLASGNRRRVALQFQRIVRGVGLGSALDLTGSPVQFDPRIGRPDPDEQGPLPLGSVPRQRPGLSVYPIRSASNLDRDGNAL